MTHPYEIYFIIGGLCALFLTLLAAEHNRVTRLFDTMKTEVMGTIDKHEVREDKVLDEIKQHLENIRTSLEDVRIDVGAIKKVTNGKSL